MNDLSPHSLDAWQAKANEPKNYGNASTIALAYIEFARAGQTTIRQALSEGGYKEIPILQRLQELLK